MVHAALLGLLLLLGLPVLVSVWVHRLETKNAMALDMGLDSSNKLHCYFHLHRRAGGGEQMKFVGLTCFRSTWTTRPWGILSLSRSVWRKVRESLAVAQVDFTLTRTACEV